MFKKILKKICFSRTKKEKEVLKTLSSDNQLFKETLQESEKELKKNKEINNKLSNILLKIDVGVAMNQEEKKFVRKLHHQKIVTK